MNKQKLFAVGLAGIVAGTAFVAGCSGNQNAAQVHAGTENESGTTRQAGGIDTSTDAQTNYFKEKIVKSQQELSAIRDKIYRIQTKWFRYPAHSSNSVEREELKAQKSNEQFVLAKIKRYEEMIEELKSRKSTETPSEATTPDSE